MTPEADIVFKWWEGLGSGDRAGLRRCSDLNQIMLQRGYIHLRLRLKATSWRHEEGIALIAAVLSHVRAQSDVSFAGRLAVRGVSEQRLLRLLARDTRQDAFRSLVRLTRMVDGIANIQSLATGLYWWNDITRRQWAYTYFGAAENEETVL